jgi:outer membrane receptor protein involved in Fe transport
MSGSYRFLVSAALPLVFTATAAHAQEAEDASESQGLGDIVVTAQKRAENLQDVPIAVTAVTSENLHASGISDTRDLVALVPGLQVRSTTGSFQPAIRGIGTSSSVVENPVSLYIDGVYYPQQREGLRELNDVEQVAVLKGPQGTLFGRNATGGVIQITTRKPSREFQGEAGVSIDNYALVKGDLYLTGGLGENAAASVSAFYSTQGNGWGKNLTTGNDTFKLRHDFSIRGKLLFEPGPDTQITLIGDYQDKSAFSNSFQDYPGTQLSFITQVPLASAYDTYAGIDSIQKFQGGGASLTIDHDFGFAKFMSISAWRKGKGQYRFANAYDPAASFIVDSPNAPNESYTQEFQLVSPKQTFSWVLGAYYFHNLRIVKGGAAPAPTSTVLNTTYGQEFTESIAPFGQVDWEFLSQTTLTLGARYTYEKRRVDSTSTILRVNGTTVIQTLQDQKSIERPSFRVALSHKFGEDVLGYASFNTGIKSGGYNVINPANPAYQPEKLTAYEAGFKTQFLDNRVRFNLAAFYYDYSNVQVIQFLAGAQTVVNGAAAKLYGVDADFEAELTSELRLSGGFMIEHSEFTDYNYAVFSTPRPGGGAIITIGSAKGKRLPLAQEFVGTVALDWHHEMDRGTLDANLTVNQNGNYFFEPDNFLVQKAYTMVNASLKYTPPGDRISFSVFGKNLADERILVQPSTQPIGYPTTYGVPPRTYGVAARVEF